MVEQPSVADCVNFEGVEVVGETLVTLRCRVGGQEVSLPRDHIVGGGLRRTGDRGSLVIPRWLAHDRALI